MTSFSYENFLKDHFQLLNIIAGVNSNGGKYSMFKILWILFNMLILLPIVILQTAGVIVDMDNLKQLVYSRYSSPAIIFGGFLQYQIIVNIKRFEALFTDIFSELMFIPKDEVEQTMAGEAFKMYNVVKYAMPLGVVFTVMSAGLTDMEKNNYLPFGCWYPMDVTISPFYEICYIQQILSFFYFGNLVSQFLVLIIGLTSFIALQCDYICHRLKMLKDDEKSLRNIIEVHKKVLR